MRATPRPPMGDSAPAVLRAGLPKVGLIEASDATFDCGTAAAARACPQLQLFYMHGLGHGIGLDVHDPDRSDGPNGRLAEGSVFTIEPGLYVRANTVDIIPDTPRNAAVKGKVAPAVRKYANIGVRIEDDYIVTATGFERITAAAPRTIEEIEREMARRGPALVRGKAMVENYKRIRAGGAAPRRRAGDGARVTAHGSRPAVVERLPVRPRQIDIPVAGGILSGIAAGDRGGRRGPGANVPRRARPRPP